MPLLYLAACGCLIGLIVRLPSSVEPRMGHLPMVCIGGGGALIGSFLVGAMGDLSVMEIDALVVLGAVFGSLLVLVAAHGYYRLCHREFEAHRPLELRLPASDLSEVAGHEAYELAPLRATQPPPPF